MSPTDIADMRRRHNLTQEQLGTLLGQNVHGGRHVRQWEAGDRHPSAAAARCIRYLDAILMARILLGKRAVENTRILLERAIRP